MAVITKKGLELAYKLAPALGTSDAIAETCSLISRQATKHARLQEIACSVEMSPAREARHEREDDACERRIAELVSKLPETDDGPFGVKFEGDPRGYTVKMVAPGEWAKLHSTWGSDGIGVA
jgi:hypothetical protein